MYTSVDVHDLLTFNATLVNQFTFSIIWVPICGPLPSPGKDGMIIIFIIALTSMASKGSTTTPPFCLSSTWTCSTTSNHVCEHKFALKLSRTCCISAPFEFLTSAAWGLNLSNVVLQNHDRAHKLGIFLSCCFHEGVNRALIGLCSIMRTI